MQINFAERLILLQALIIRRVPKNARIERQLLLEALQADDKLVQERKPDLYFHHTQLSLGQEVNTCIDLEYIEAGAKGCTSLRRTRLGDQFLSILEEHLEDHLDNMPMSEVGVLDFLSYL